MKFVGSDCGASGQVIHRMEINIIFLYPETLNRHHYSNVEIKFATPISLSY